jgi:hypothetical protein
MNKFITIKRSYAKPVKKECVIQDLKGQGKSKRVKNKFIGMNLKMKVKWKQFNKKLDH